MSLITISLLSGKIQGTRVEFRPGTLADTCLHKVLWDSRYLKQGTFGAVQRNFSQVQAATKGVFAFALFALGCAATPAAAEQVGGLPLKTCAFHLSPMAMSTKIFPQPAEPPDIVQLPVAKILQDGS